MHVYTRRLDRLEQQQCGDTDADEMSDQAVKDLFLAKLGTLTERLADPDARPASTLERIAWLWSRDADAAQRELQTLAERYTQ